MAGVCKCVTLSNLDGLLEVPHVLSDAEFNVPFHTLPPACGFFSWLT